MKELINVIGTIGAVSMFWVLFYTFMSAFFTEEKKGMIDINKYGEANIEFVLFIVFAPFVIYTLIDSLNALLSKK